MVFMSITLFNNYLLVKYPTIKQSNLLKHHFVCIRVENKREGQSEGFKEAKALSMARKE